MSQRPAIQKHNYIYSSNTFFIAWASESAYLKHAYMSIAIDLVAWRVGVPDLGQMSEQLAAALEELERVLTEIQLLQAHQQYHPKHVPSAAFLAAVSFGELRHVPAKYRFYESSRKSNHASCWLGKLSSGIKGPAIIPYTASHAL